MVGKAIALSGEIIFGIPILVQQTDAARNRGEGASTAQAPIRPNMPGGVPAGGGSVGALSANRFKNMNPSLPVPPHLVNGADGTAAQLQAVANLGKPSNGAARLYIGNLYFELTDSDVRAVFEPFGDIEEVELHREPTGKSKGFAFVQFRLSDDADKAIEAMNGFELAGRSLRVGYSNSSGGGKIPMGTTMSSHNQAALMASTGKAGDNSGWTSLCSTPLCWSSPVSPLPVARGIDSVNGFS